MRVRARLDLDEAAAFDALYRAHSDQVYRFALRRSSDRAVADEVRSAVFFEAWRRRHDVDLSGRAALPWLYGVAENVLRNHRRSTRRRDAAVQRVLCERAEADLADGIAERLDLTARAAAALAEVKALPPGEQAVVALCLIRGLTYAAAASELGIPIGTVRSRLARARSRLAAHSSFH